MSESPLATFAGPIAATAGGLFAATHLAMFLTADRSDLVAMMSDPPFLVFNAAYAVTFPLLLIALVALYLRQAAQSGLLGAIAFCVALTGTMALAGDMWFEGFAVPWLAQVAPSVFAATRSGTLEAAWLVSVILFSRLDTVRPRLASGPCTAADACPSLWRSVAFSDSRPPCRPGASPSGWPYRQPESG